MHISHVLMLGLRQLPACTFACTSLVILTHFVTRHAHSIVMLCPPISQKGFLLMSQTGKETLQIPCSI